MQPDELSDEDIARQALARRRAEMGEGASVRDLEVPGVFSRGTVARWLDGDYGMKHASKRKILRWLGAPAQTSPSYAEGIAFAVARVEEVLAVLRAMLPGGLRVDGGVGEAGIVVRMSEAGEEETLKLLQQLTQDLARQARSTHGAEVAGAPLRR